MNIRWLTIFSMAMLVGLCGCSHETLDYDTAMNLLKERGLEPEKLSFSAAPPAGQSNDPVSLAYQTLINGHVLECSQQPNTGLLCKPGSAGTDLIQSGPTELALVTGHWIPAVIVDINRTGNSSASADVRFSYEPTTLYEEYRAAFDALRSTSSQVTKEGKTAHALFEKHEDGWQIEALQ